VLAGENIDRDPYQRTAGSHVTGDAPRLRRRVDMTSDVKTWSEKFYVMTFSLFCGASEETEPVKDDG
jgi:hypothetical protein